MLFDAQANAQWCRFIAEKIGRIVKDPATAEKLVPKDHRFGEKRPPFVSGYFEAYNDPKVSLVDLTETPIVRVTETGIDTTQDRQALDIIVWATGFDFGTGALLHMDIEGRDGRKLADAWAEGPRTFLGLQTSGFPNFFFPGGPHAAAGNNPRYNSDQVDFVTDTLLYLRDHGCDTIEVDPGPEARWTAMVDRGAAKSSFGEVSYYFGTNIPGKPKKYLLNAGGRPKLFSIIAEVVENDYQGFRLTGAPEPAPSGR
jgi:cation diffusion facilitator CzcD-associated flavoprotein CzcO